MKTLGERIKYLREKRNLSKNELGKRVKTSHVQIIKYESNAQIPSATMLLKIANELSTSTDYLLKGLPDYNELLKRLKSLPPYLQLEIFELVDEKTQLYNLRILLKDTVPSLI